MARRQTDVKALFSASNSDEEQWDVTRETNHNDQGDKGLKFGNMRLSPTLHLHDDDDDDDLYDETDEGRQLLLSSGQIRLQDNGGGPGLAADESGGGEHYTVEEAVESIGLGWFQVKMFLICGMLTVTDALEMLLLSVLSPVLRCEWMLTESQVAFITTVVFLGMFSGSHIWGSWSDKFGRKPIIFICAAGIGYFGLLTSFSPNYFWMILLRGLVGTGFGGVVQAFTLLAEYLPTKYRAKLLISYQVMWAAGCCFEVLMAYFIIPTLGWRYLVAGSALPMVVTLLCMGFLPESARYLVSAGRKEDAKEVLEAIAKLNNSKLPPGELVKNPPTPRGHMKDLFAPEYRITTIGIWFLWFVTAFTYYGIILAQSEILEFHSEGSCDANVKKFTDQDCHCNMLTKNDYVQMIISTFGEFVAIPLNILLIDSIGRKYTTAVNFLGAAIFFFLVNICTSRTVETFFIFGIRAFATGIFNTIYIYTTEVYPTFVRSLGLGSGSAMARIGAMLTPFVAQILLKRSLPAALCLYGGLCLVSAVVIAILPIETKGRDMKQHA